MQQGVRYVLLDDTFLLFLEVHRVLRYVNASALASGLGLDDEGLDQSSFSGLDEVVSNFGVIVGVEEGPGHEIVVLGEFFFHFGQGEG